MITSITLIVTFLVALNFILLIFSCNKTKKRQKQTVTTITSVKYTSLATNQLDTRQLAPTGS